ncbi:MAG: hypothetical protein OXR67_17275 [Chloroflexota bacterium]|nr:hypothetical protein [Chloroflexota bacterium]
MVIIMRQPIRQMNAKGITASKAYLANLRAGQVDAPFPDYALSDAKYSDVLEPAVIIEARSFANRREAGEYLSEKLAHFPIEEVQQNYGLWSWLGMFYFNSIVNQDDSGNPDLGRDSDAAYVLDPASPGWGDNRHRLLMAYETYTFHGEDAWFMLDQPVNSADQLTNRLSGKPTIFRSRGIVKLAHVLYTDPSTRRRKRGFGGGGQNQRSPGNLMRFIDVLDQLYMTYDVYGMTAEELMKLLPVEFDRWLPGVSSNNSESDTSRTSRGLASFLPSIRRRQ